MQRGSSYGTTLQVADMVWLLGHDSINSPSWLLGQRLIDESHTQVKGVGRVVNKPRWLSNSQAASEGSVACTTRGRQGVLAKAWL